MANGTSAERKAMIEVLIAEIHIHNQEIIPVFKIPQQGTAADISRDATTSTNQPWFAQWSTRWRY